MPYHPENAVVWAEIPVSNLDASAKFYAEVMGYDMRRDESGHKPVVDIMAIGVAGHLYEAPPAPRGTGMTLHLAVDGALEDALARAASAGAKQTTPIITIPPGRFAKIEDLDGNSIGLFQPA
jgi:predicted enzyme related to lactoylglutathione lyase